jgi:hypothetical protein
MNMDEGKMTKIYWTGEYDLNGIRFFVLLQSHVISSAYLMISAAVCRDCESNRQFPPPLTADAVELSV